MVIVKHAVKRASYEYPDEATARARCAQAVEQSEGELTFKAEKDGSFTILRAKGKEE